MKSLVAKNLSVSFFVTVGTFPVPPFLFPFLQDLTMVSKRLMLSKVLEMLLRPPQSPLENGPVKTAVGILSNLS